MVYFSRSSKEKIIELPCNLHSKINKNLSINVQINLQSNESVCKT